MRGYPQFSFCISIWITLVKIYISCTIINLGKNTFELVSTSCIPYYYVFKYKLFIMYFEFVGMLTKRKADSGDEIGDPRKTLGTRIAGSGADLFPGDFRGLSGGERNDRRKYVCVPRLVAVRFAWRIMSVWSTMN